MNSHIDFYRVSSLEKVFTGKAPQKSDGEQLCGFKNEVISFQTAVRFEAPRDEMWFGPSRISLTVNVNSPISDYVHIRQVKLSPCTLPVPIKYDNDYLSSEPIMFPDLLRELEDNTFHLPVWQWHALWIDVLPKSELAAGKYPIIITISDEHGRQLASIKEEVTVLDAELPEQKLIYTQWFHADCLADYYGVEPFSEEHWVIMERFIKEAANLGNNMILTPIFTPPLDTSPDVLRTNVQLLDINIENGEYSFDFSRLERWVDMCKRCGIKYFEMNHLFSQWGADYCPNIFATVNGRYTQLFGMKIPVKNEQYHIFLSHMLPALVKKLKALGLSGKCWFHISDEPQKNHLKSYMYAKQLIEPYLEGFPIIDAMSDVDFYSCGVIKIPVCTTDTIEPFLELNISELWAYYCGGQSVDVSNRFFAMPSYRNRIIGAQLYKFGIKGFLHWGYNFYNSALSLKHINPYEITDADSAFASGDAFTVYPGEGGYPEESIRAIVFLHALQDMRAFELLEQLSDKQTVISILEEGLGYPLSFKDYPRNNDYLPNVRQRVNQKIMELIQKSSSRQNAKIILMAE